MAKQAAKKKGKRKTKFDDSESSSEEESSSQVSEEIETSELEDEMPEMNDSKDKEDKQDDSQSTNLENSTFSVSTAHHEHNVEALDDIFPGIQSEILLIVTYESILFVDNAHREKPLLEVKLDELLYIMGKGDQLKIAFQLN